MKIFGTVDSFVESADASLKLGRLVANFEFLKALLTYGTFDQYRIFCPTFDNLKLLQQRLEASISDDAILSRVMLSHHLNFPDALGNTDFSAFHVGGWSWYLPRLAWLRSKYQAHFPLTGIIHSLDTPEVMRDVRELMRAPLMACDSVICTSGPGRQAFQNYFDAAHAQDPSLSFPGRLDLIPLGVGDECFLARDRQAARARLGLETTGVLLLYVGRMSIFTKADLVPLLYTFLRLREAEREPVYLVLAGGADAGNLTNLQMAIQELGLGDRVLLRPNIEDAEKFQLYAAADVFVSPIDNFQETFGIAVVEAMAHGLPVVVSDFDGYRDLVEEGVMGYLIPTVWLPLPERLADIRGILEPSLASFYAAQAVALDQEVLFERLLRLVQEPSLRKDLGEVARTRARAFHWREIIRRYELLWGELKHRAGEIDFTASVVDPNVSDAVSLFGHYPTRMFSNTVTLGLSDLGRAVLANRILMPATYADIAPLLPADLVEWVLKKLAVEGKTLRELHEGLTSDFAGSPEGIDLIASWLLKYGLLKADSRC